MIPKKSATLALWTANVALTIVRAESQTLPWEREIPWWQAAQRVMMESTLNATNPAAAIF
jgi:hypothetical protein